ncbi:hypothetical protein K678_16690 [Magnetospirillum fulvum MGU-K5]|uniref:Uncharacterized protein n=1 Tax=Magnetospirillum fulvum MGU-K5 TaxID=1316936 RepID=S9TDK2_MAGFU|nr:hypothetical protein K678_16690 [Magnetospirillum fulvum MGU-K5]
MTAALWTMGRTLASLFPAILRIMPPLPPRGQNGHTQTECNTIRPIDICESEGQNPGLEWGVNGRAGFGRLSVDHPICSPPRLLIDDHHGTARQFFRMFVLGTGDR